MTTPPKQEVQVNGLFQTPVLATVLPDCASLNLALEKAILDREKAHPSTQHSNLGGWQSDTDFLSWGGAAAQTLLVHGRALVDRLTADRQGKPVKVDWHINAWANVNRQNQGNEYHTHAGCFWSAVYYVADGGVGADPALGGQLEFADPRGVGPAMHAPLLAFSFPGGLSVGASEAIAPRAGMMVIFPSFLSHGVSPYLGNDIRISIAINFSATPTLNPAPA
ncbi:MAG: TIGR02466 family protein [Proteobacteria bacterium]|nr:TIGR02466 family protein [Pseudomonadota bacterium]